MDILTTAQQKHGPIPEQASHETKDEDQRCLFGVRHVLLHLRDCLDLDNLPG